MARQQNLIASLDQLSRVERVDFDRVPPAELLAEYRAVYSEMTRLRRNRAYATTHLMNRADRERAATERRVMAMATAVHRRARAVSVDLHEARDRGPEAVLEALDTAISRHEALDHEPGGLPELVYSQRRRLWITAGAVSAIAVAAVLVAQLL